VRLVAFEGGFGRIDGDNVITMGPDLLEYLETGQSKDGQVRALGDVHLKAPVARPRKILCIGLNYRDHALETGQAIPERPIVFTKFANSVIGPGESIRVPRVAGDIDYEAELGVVIGARCFDVSQSDALGSVAGYVCLNDVSSRSLQFETGQWTRGKAVDTFLPMGPWILTADEVSDPQSLSIKCSVNGDVRQNSNTTEMIFGVAELVSFLSQTITLEPGDVIATGTPPGVGMAAHPPRWLASGDVVSVEIEGLGTLENTVTT
jgi:2-keto-4-pentenoate hydratase/2-oxohepta-3-ene-1,7-dioic acid hydratase in catechol pathway